MKTNLRNIQLAVSALEAEINKTAIAEQHIVEIAEAREVIAMTRGSDVIADLHTLIRSGLPVIINLRELASVEARKAAQIEPGRAAAR